MSLKKSLKIFLDKKAQSSLEYFILLALIGTLTLLTANSLLNNARKSGRGLFVEAANRILAGGSSTPIMK